MSVRQRIGHFRSSRTYVALAVAVLMLISTL
jgi:hypothetical protein